MRTVLTISLVFLSCLGMAQGGLELYRGNQAYYDGDLDQAEGHYRRSLSENPNRFESHFNLGNAKMKKQNVEDAVKSYQQAIDAESDPLKQARSYHNLGNAHLQSQQIDPAIEAYKNALRLNPQDDETRYNFAYAQKMKQQHEQQEQQQDQQEQEEEEQDQNEENQDGDQEQDQQEQQQDENGDQENQDENESQEEKEGDQEKQEDGEPQEEKEGEGKPKRPIELTPREAEQLLEAAKNEDEKTMMRMRKQLGTDKKIEKDW